jgi:hypothetical protein
MEDVVEKMEDGKDKELMKILAEGGKPFIRKSDGNAVKVSEDKEIKYKDYDDQELTLAVPSGSYVVVNEDSCCPKIVTAEDWESKNKFVEGEKPKVVEKKDNSPKIGIELMAEDNN